MIPINQVTIEESYLYASFNNAAEKGGLSSIYDDL